MRLIRHNGLTVRAAGGVDGNGGGDGPVAVLLHGFGAPGDDLVSLAREIRTRRPLRYLFPAAPLELAAGLMEARAWWPIDWEARQRRIAERGLLDLSDQEPDGLAPARAAITGLLHDLPALLGGPVPGVVLGGFSQGAMLACDTALRTDLPLHGLVLLSPTLLARQAWERRLPERAGLPVFVSHGQMDAVLPFTMAERLQRLLAEAGMAVTWEPFGGGHEIPPPVVRRLGGFLDGLDG